MPRETLQADLVTLYEYHHGRDPEFVTPPVISGSVREQPQMGRKLYEYSLPALLVQAGEPYYADDVDKHEFVQNAISIAKSYDPDGQRFIQEKGFAAQPESCSESKMKSLE